mgnify:CR=1 FL=1
MKIKPIILCGGSGSRLNIKNNNNTPKQFIDFGNWTLFDKTLQRIKSSIFDAPVISTNKTYLKKVRHYLKKHKIVKYKIVVEPVKKNTAPAILSSALIKDIHQKQALMFFSADHLIEKKKILELSLQKNKLNLSDENIFIFGIKPTSPSSEYGYFLTKKNKNIEKVIQFVEKPTALKAKKIIKKKGLWNSGMFFIRKESIINNFKKYQPTIYRNCIKAIDNSKFNSNTYFLDKKYFIKIPSKSFDYAILEKTKNIYAIKLDMPWVDLGSWKEILKMYNKNYKKYKKKKNIFYRPWGKYINLYKGNNFLIKELSVKQNGKLSLQKHYHRMEHWLVTQGEAEITLNKKIILKKPNDYVFIPAKSIHRIYNKGKKTLKIMEAQVGSILKESDIVRYHDIYGRVKNI